MARKNLFRLALCASALFQAGCSDPEPGLTTSNNYECFDGYCDFTMHIDNAGSDTFDMYYEVKAYARTSDNRGNRSTVLVGELRRDYVSAGRETVALREQFEVASEPTMVSVASGATRR